MKNKKLFAILTLVCFMFTLMPVAAFAADPYAWIEDGKETVKLTYEVDKDGNVVVGGDGNKVIKKATVQVQLNNIAKDSYLFAVKDGKVYDKLEWNGVKTGTFLEVAKTHARVTLAFAEEGVYTVYLVEKDDYTINVIGTELADGVVGPTGAANKLIAYQDGKFILENNVITVNPVAANYVLEASVDGVNFYAEGYHNDANKNDKVDDGEATFESEIASKLATISNGYDNEELWIRLKNNNVEVANATLDITTNSYAIESSKETVVTNPNGIAKVKLSSVLAGDFKVYVEYGSKADLTIDVTADSTKPAVIETVYVPTAPIALDSALNTSEITFTIADINGNNVDNSPKLVKYDGVNANDYTIKVVEAPKGASVKASNLELFYDKDSATWGLTGADLDVEGDYTFKVMLANGASATATITVKEFQKPVELKMVYKQNSVELDGEAVLHKLYYVDANGVTKSVKNKIGGDVKLAANGYAVDTFNTTNGLLTVEADEKYVGSKVTVIAVAEKYNLTTSVELLVASEAAGVKYASTEADVAVNNTLVANIVDENGNNVGLASGIAKANVSYVVLEKPEGAKVAISTKADNNLATKGEFKVSFTANEVGNYKVQTVVSYKQANDVVKYYTGIETITVGNTAFNDIVVMSIGSNEIVVNEATKVIPAAPVIENNRTFVPFRALIEAFGAEVAWDEATQAVTAELGDVTVVMSIGSAVYTVNGVAKTMDVAPFINASSTMIPVRFVAEEFGISVTPTYDENGATADILFAK